jgi:4-oxalocrotonate tautomerase
MPIVTVAALEGRNVDQKRSLVKDVTEAVIKNYNVAPDSVTIIIQDLSKENLAQAGKLKLDQ